MHAKEAVDNLKILVKQDLQATLHSELSSSKILGEEEAEHILLHLLSIAAIRVNDACINLNELLRGDSVLDGYKEALDIIQTNDNEARISFNKTKAADDAYRSAWKNYEAAKEKCKSAGHEVSVFVDELKPEDAPYYKELARKYLDELDGGV